MRPEMREYNYDWMMGSTLKAASNLANGFPKEAALALNYIPYARGASKALMDEGDPGIQLFKLLSNYYENILLAHSRGKKLVATSFCFSPVIFFAMDIVPVCMEMMTGLGNILWKRGMSDYLDFAFEAGLPETSCSSQRGSMGAYLAGLGETIDFVLNNMAGACDTNANAFAFLSAYLNKPFYQMNSPNTIGDPRSEAYHLADYSAMIRFLEEQTGEKLDYDRLAEILAEVEIQDELITDVEEFHMLKPTPLTPLDNLILYVGRFMFSGRVEYTNVLKALYQKALPKARAGISGLRSGEEKLRVLMIYIDHYTFDFNFWKWFEENGVAHIGSQLSHHFRDTVPYAADLPGSVYSVDTSSPAAMLNTVAQMNARGPMVRSIRGPYDGPFMWLEETLTLARHFSADCAVFNGTPGCRNTWSNNKLMARDLEKAGIPTLILNDDAFDDRVENWDATRERMEEFFTIRGLL